MSERHVVVTGSTRGIGRGLAAEFLALGCRVTINGRSEAAVREAVAELTEKYEKDRVFGLAGDVTSMEDMRTLWREAVSSLGPVDIWVNNAGIGQSWARFEALDELEVRSVVDVNILGTINGCRVAIDGMRSRGGQIFNMEGYGSDGRTGQLLTVYGMSKRAVRYLSRSLVKELAGSPVRIGTLSPGMVVTDFILKPMPPDELERSKRIFNIIADRVETVTPYLAKKVLENRKHGARIRWISNAGIFLRFMIAPFRKRDLFSD